MLSFEEAKTRLRSVFEKYDMTQIDGDRHRLSLNNETVNVITLKTSLTGSDRARPQIRVFTEKIVEIANQSFDSNEKFFCFIHCSHTKTQLKFDQLEPSEYIVALESDWNTAGGRIDVRSIYDRIEDVMTAEHFNYLKINSEQHTTPSVRLASVFRLNDDGLKELEGYLKYFDSRLISKEPDTTEPPKLKTAGINKIYFGAPGTGKSYAVREFIKNNGISDYKDSEGHSNVFRTTLHPEYTYYDFVGQVMPKVKKVKGNDEDDSEKSLITYDFVPKVFTEALSRAIEVEKSEEPVFLILEEMSRANVAAVFGDLFQLLDRKVDTGESEYQIYNDLIASWVHGDENKPVSLPRNLFIIGTVNTNDQNVFVMDTAFKRRFQFEYVPADNVAIDENTGEPLNNYSFTLSESGEELNFDWISLYRALNRFITKKVENGGLGLNEDKQIGQFFIRFSDKEDSEETNFGQIYGKLLNYLYDDIESAAYSSGLSLFKDEVQSYGNAYRLLRERKNVFSEAFLDVYREVKSET